MMKKLLLGIGTFVAAAAPVATVVACGSKSPTEILEDALAKPVERRTEETRNVNIHFDLDNIHGASGFDTWYANSIKNSNSSLASIMNNMGQEVQSIAQRLEVSNLSPSDGANAIVSIRQKLYDLVAKFHTINTKVTINYKGADHIVFTNARTTPAYFNYDVINSLHSRTDFEHVMHSYQKYMGWLIEGINPTGEVPGVKAFFGSDAYKAWIKDNYTDAHKSLSGQFSLSQTMVSRYNSFLPRAPQELKLVINPTPGQIDAYFASINSAVNSGMIQEEIANTLIK